MGRAIRQKSGNFKSLAQSDLIQRFPETIQVDTRSLASTLTKMQAAHSQTHGELHKVQQALNDTNLQLMSMQQIIENQNRSLEDMKLQFQHMLGILKTRLMRHSPPTSSAHIAQDEVDPVVNPSSDHSVYQGEIPLDLTMPIQQGYVDFYVKRVNQCFEAMKKTVAQRKKVCRTDERKKQITKEWNAIKSRICSYKWFIALMNSALDHPSVDGEPSDAFARPAWVQSLWDRARDASTRLCLSYMPENHPQTVASVLNVKPTLIDEATFRGKLPNPTTDEMREAQNSLIQALLSNRTKNKKQKRQQQQ